MRRADEEIEREFRLTNEELAAQRERDKHIRREALPPEKRRIAEYRRAYYEANKDSIAEKQRWIADERKARGYTQRNLAGFAGCSQPLIAQLENGKVLLERCARRDAICRFLKGVSYEELVAQGL